MKDGRRFGLTIFQVVLSIILIALVIFSVGVNYIFGSSMRSGSVFGKNVYIMNTDLMDSEGGIPNGSAVIGDSNEIAVLIKGNVILFSEEVGVENVMRIVEVVHNTDNTVYKVAADNAPDNILNVPKENVIAKCTVHSEKLGAVITFLKSMVGILAGMILPCLILLMLLMLKIFSIRRREREEDNIVFPETHGIGSGNSEMRDPSANPLFDPTMASKPDMSFEMKKSSIAENFSMKPAAKKNAATGPAERNVQTESAVEKFRAAVDEKPSVPVSRKASLAADPAALGRDEKMAAIKSALENNQSNQQSVNTDMTTTFKVPDASASETYTQPAQSQPVAEPDMNQQSAYVMPDTSAAPVYTQPSVLSQPTAPAPKPVAKKQDNIKSIDDLIKALEEEKKKL